MTEHAYPGYIKTARYLEEARQRKEVFSPGYCQVLLETLEAYADEARTYRALLTEYVALIDEGDGFTEIEDMMDWKHAIQLLQQRTKLLLGQD